MKNHRVIEFACERLEAREMLANVSVLAAGVTGSESLQLLIGGQVVRQWNNVGGDAVARDFVTLSHTTPNAVSAEDVRLEFINDLYDPSNNIDRNIRIDAIRIDNVRYEAEHPSVFSTGTWKAEDGVQPGFRESEYLHTNGYMQFADLDVPGTTIVVRARGDEGGESFNLLVNESVVDSFTVSNSFGDFTYQSVAAVSPDDVRVEFTNDLFDPANGVDRNLVVDYVSLNGQIYETESPSVFSTGTWLPEDGVTPGFRQGETLHSNGYFQYSAETSGGTQILIRAAGDEGVESFELLINEVVVASFVATNQFANYTYQADSQVTADQVRVQFVGDVFDPANGIDQNLQVDYIQIEGEIYQTESPSVFSTGTWNEDDNAIVPGFWQSETLHSDGYFQYASTDIDGGFISLESSVINVSEADGAAVLTVLRSGGSSGVTSVDYNTVSITAIDGNDYSGQSGTLTFLDGETTKSISVPLFNDIDVEANEQFAVTIDNVEGTGTLLAPRTATVTIDDDDSIQATGDGLLGEYFDSLNFNGYFNNRIDSTVNFNWGSSAPQNGMGSDSFSIRWTGQIEPRYTETYTFTTNSDDGIRLWINDQLVINEWNDHAATLHSGTIDLVAGQFYDIRMEYYERTGEAVAQLFWSSTTQTNEIVPQSQLYAADPPDVDPGGELLTQVLYSNLSEPTALTFSPDGTRTYIAQKGGVVRVAVNGNLRPAPVLDFSAIVNSPRDRGLLDIAVHPDFASNPYLYLLYTYDPPEVFQQSAGTLAGPDGFGNRAGRLTRVTLDAATNYTSIVAGSEVTILGSNSTWNNFNGFVNSTNDFNEPPAGILANGTNIQDFVASDSESHTVGSLDFGPDGALYVSIGDGTSYNQVDPRTFRVQDIDNLSGKLLRIDPLTGAGLAGNPYFQSNNPFSNRSKVYQRGLRNPFRISVHPQTGEVFIGDVGWGQWEEVNRAGAGANFGWPYYEGGNGINLQTAGYRDRPESQAFYQSGQSATPAIVALNHAADGINAIVGGDIYTGTAFPAQYQGDYFFNDLGAGIVRTVSFDANGNVSSVDTFTTGAQFVVQMKQGPDGSMYFVNLVNGTVGRWTFAPVASLAGFETESAPWGETFSTAATGQGVTIALIDTGMDHTHPDLQNTRWLNPGEFAGDGIDNDGNGFVDDRFGYDFVDDDANLADAHGHGTGMASVIAAIGNGGVAGNAPGADIMMLRAIGENGLGLADDVAMAIRYAVDNGADIINLPLVVEDVQSVRDAVAYAEANNVLIVAAAGNDGASQPAFPANLAQEYANVVSVGALGPDGAVLPESNEGDDHPPLVYALGVAAVSQPGGGKSVFRGTSVASSVVARAAAIAMELNSDLSSSQVRQLLMASTVVEAGPDGSTVRRLSVEQVVDRATRSKQFRFVQRGTGWIVVGTNGDETYEMGIESRLLMIDGISYEVPVGLRRVTIQSKGGNDTLKLIGSNNQDIVTATEGFVRLVADSLLVRGNRFSNVMVDGGAGVDIVRMLGSRNDDWFGVGEGRTAMQIGSQGVVVTNVETVRINAGLGDDTAFVQGTSGNDRINTRPRTARLRSGVLDFFVRNTERISIAASTGNDRASLRGTTGDDELQIGATYGLLRGATFQTLVLDFDTTNVSMGAGDDVVTLIDIDEPTALATHNVLGSESIVAGLPSGLDESGLPEILDAESLEDYRIALELLI